MSQILKSTSDFMKNFIKKHLDVCTQYGYDRVKYEYEHRELTMYRLHGRSNLKWLIILAARC